MEENVSKGIVFTDVETLGLGDKAIAWEMSFIDGDTNEVFNYWFDIDVSIADSGAMRLTRYYERRANENPIFAEPRQAASHIATLTANKVLAGAVTWFDANAIERFLRANGQAPAWDYHLLDIEAYCAGAYGIVPPWKLTDLSRRIGIDPTAFEHHTAFGDARLSKAMYEKAARKNRS